MDIAQRLEQAANAADNEHSWPLLTVAETREAASEIRRVRVPAPELTEEQVREIAANLAKLFGEAWSKEIRDWQHRGSSFQARQAEKQ